MVDKENQLALVKGFVKNEDIKRRFNDILGDRAGAYMASIVNTVAQSEALQKSDAQSIMNAAFIAATLDLPVDPNLGFAAIVPYAGKAQFQMMTKGFIQLAIRSGQYQEMNVSEVYADEIKEYNPITGEIIFNPFDQCTMRANEEVAGIVGYYAYFKLTNGFQKFLYMTIKQIESHGKRYSQTYKKGFGNWVDQKDAMMRKTVIKLLLSKWGLLSIQMQKGMVYDQAIVNDDMEPEYTDAEIIHTPKSSLDAEEPEPC